MVLGFCPMQLLFCKYLDSDADFLAEWLSSENWPFHVKQNPSRTDVKRWIRTGSYNGEDVESYWILSKGQKLGLITVSGLFDEPSIDLRISAAYRGTGVGTFAVQWLVQNIFSREMSAERLRAHVRSDNLPMQTVLRSNGFIKVVHAESSWPDQKRQVLFDSCIYELLKDDWVDSRNFARASILLTVA